MRLTIRRSQHAVALPGNPNGVVFAVYFQLSLLPEEEQWAGRMSLRTKLVVWPDGCEQEQKCPMPRWSVRDLTGGISFQPSASRSDEAPYSSLRLVLHAEKDVRRGCERLAETLRDGQSYHGAEELFFDTSR